jgi:hypothetical protein
LKVEETGTDGTNHFVTATGRTLDPIHTIWTWKILDPGYQNIDTLAGPIMAPNAYSQPHHGYNNHYYNTRIYKHVAEVQTAVAAPPTYTELTITAYSPVHLVVTDPQGKKIGYDPIADKEYDTLPNSFYEWGGYRNPLTGISSGVPKTKKVVINNPVTGEYTIQAIGTESGSYSMSAEYYNFSSKAEVKEYSDHYAITVGELHEHSITYSSTAPGPMPFTAGYSGGGQKPSDVNKFLRYVKPVESRNKIPAGTTFYDLIISYGATTDPATFAADLDGVNVTNLFNARAGTTETVTIPLTAGSQTLRLSVDGLNDANRNTTDTDRLTFIVQ